MFGLVGGVTVGLLGGSADVPQGPLAARWPTPREQRVLVVGLGGILAVALVVGLAGGLVFGLAGGLAFGLFLLAVGLAVGLTMRLPGGLVQFWSIPLASAHAVSPLDVYRSDRRHTLVIGLLGMLPFWLLAMLATGLIGQLMNGLLFGVLGGLVLGYVAGGLGPALQLTEVQIIWWLRGQRVQFVPLLQTALDRQILRQAGAVYQFRHAALQDFLQIHAHTAERSAGAIDAENPNSPDRR